MAFVASFVCGLCLARVARVRKLFIFVSCINCYEIPKMNYLKIMRGYIKRADGLCVNAVWLLITGLLMCQGCLSVNFWEKDAQLTIDRNRIEVLSDMLSGEVVKDSVIIVSNRSWDAEIVPAVDWITLERNEFEALDGVTKEIPLRIFFSDNKSDFPRVASLMITSGEITETVKITQSSLSPRLIVTSPKYEDLAFDGDSCVFEVMANVPWTVSVGDKSEGMSISLKEDVRNGGGTVTVTLDEHFDFEFPRYADLLFTGVDCEDVSRRVTQAKAVPYSRIIGVTGGEEILPSIGGTRTLTVKANADWIIGINEADVDNVTFSKTGGSRGETSVMMTFEGTPSFDARRDFTVRCETVSDGEDDGRNQWTFTQERGSLLRFLFLYEGKWYWPFYCTNGTWPRISLSIGKPESPGEVENFETYAGYVLKLFSNYGYVFGNQGIRFGHLSSFLGDYIELPVIQGKSLVQINLYPDEEHKYSSLTAKVVAAGALDNPAVGVPEEGLYENGVRTWHLDGEESQAYWIIPLQNATYSVEILECIYK